MTEDTALEAALRRVTAPPHADEEAVVRIAQRLESLPLQRRPLAWWPSALMDFEFARAWPRVAALAGTAVLGISIGI